MRTIVDILFLCDHVNNLARIESVCTFKVGLRSWIISISWIKQSNLFRHFFSTAPSYLHDHKETKCLLLFSLIYIQTMMKQSLCLDNDGSTIETSDSISFNQWRCFTNNAESFLLPVFWNLNKLAVKMLFSCQAWAEGQGTSDYHVIRSLQKTASSDRKWPEIP